VCDNSCATCYGPKSDECIKCVPGKILYGTSCIDKCPPGEELSSIDNRCYPISDFCGDGVVEDFEECDDGNDVGLDGCSGKCKNETGWRCENPFRGRSVCKNICGDGLLIIGKEWCDDGNSLDLDGCSSNCMLESGSFCNTNGTNIPASVCRCSALLDYAEFSVDFTALNFTFSR
jgi:cysteine-rich repeat protein